MFVSWRHTRWGALPLKLLAVNGEDSGLRRLSARCAEVPHPPPLLHVRRDLQPWCQLWARLGLKPQAEQSPPLQGDPPPSSPWTEEEGRGDEGSGFGELLVPDAVRLIRLGAET